MDLSLNESQTILVDTFNDFFTNECPPSLVRETEDIGFSASLWQLFSEMGAPGMGLPESAGGLGLELLELCLVATAAGKVLAPLPFAEVACAGRLLARFSDDVPRFERVVEGSEIISILDPVSSGADRTSVLVPWGGVADSLLTMEGDSLYLYSDGVKRRSETPANLGSAAHAFWDLSVDTGTEKIKLAQGADIIEAFADALAEWKLLVAASQLGLARQALAIGVEYANTREQFGTLIGSFQAIAHPLADCFGRTDGSELLVWEAAWAATAEPERFRELCGMAFVFCSQTAKETAAISLHTHGGYGFTEEYDIQLYYRRAAAWAMMSGGIRKGLLGVSAERYSSNIKNSGSC